MINARSRLFGSLRGFVENHLRGLVTWDGVHVDPSIPADKLPNGRRNPEGLFKEIVTVHFGDYELTVQSPNYDPPLGWITLSAAGTVAVEGPLDQTVWEQAGAFIRNRGMRKEHGSRRSDSRWFAPI